MASRHFGHARFSTLALPALAIAFSAPALAQKRADVEAEQRRGPTRFEAVPLVRMQVVPLSATLSPHIGVNGGGIAGACPPVVLTYTTNPALFTGPAQFNLETGMVETEIAAVSIVAPPEAFPVTIRTIEMVWGRPASNQVETTQYSIMFWEGPPAGPALDEFSSQSGDLPPIVIQPSGQPAGVNVQITIDPSDPDQVVLTDNGSHTFSVGFRIDHHNSPPTASCICPPPVGSFGTLPAICCPPAQSLNTFPAIDTDGLAQPSRNWLYARACPGATGIPCAAPAGWYTSSQAGITGDWVIRTTYEPFACGISTGACCLNGGTQCVPGMTQNNCVSAGGVYQGDNTNCNNGCPPPTGACCTGNNSCQQMTQAQCTAANGAFAGIGVACGANTCTNSVCCVPSTQQCVVTSFTTCGLANGTYHPGLTCGNYVCFPMGACCLENGTCNAGPMSPAQCQALGGTFAGNATTCANANCQPPAGACCIGTGCATGLTQASCAGLGGTWAYPATSCGQFTCPYCPADINHSGGVTVDDLLNVITHWGPCINCAADIAPPPFGNNQVNVDDLLFVITHWGPCL